MEQSSLVQRYLEERDAVLGFLIALTRDFQIAEELFQEVSLVVIAEARKDIDVQNVSAWVREIARRRVAEYYRKRSRLAPTSPFSESLADLIDQSFAENEELLEQQQTRMRFLLECLRKLTGRSRELVQGFYHRRQSLQQLANSMGWQVDSVKVALSRARKVLGDCVRVKMQTVTEEQNHE
jgi:RNA polymerase sigma-70 factor (ECF subfamily)